MAHYGNSLTGDFAWSLTMTDIVTAAPSGTKALKASWSRFRPSKQLPFPLRGFDCDNGSKFLNQPLLRYFTDHPQKPAFTRSRPYKKNDNAHVEQKNWTHARQLFGYNRLDKYELVLLMNKLYSTFMVSFAESLLPQSETQTKAPRWCQNH